MHWPFRKARENPDPTLQDAEAHVRDLTQRAHQVERVLRPRHDRNHWAETVDRLYRGQETSA